MKNSSNTNYMQIVGIVSQMVIMIALGFWGGHQLDVYLGNEQAIYTLIIGLVVMFGTLYLTVTRINKIFENNDEEV